MIRFACPTCKAALKVPPERAGKVLPCPRCDDKIKIPMKSEVEDAPAPRLAPSAARTLPRPKQKASDEAIDNGFEVVEDEPKPRPRLKPKPAAQEEEDFEVIEEKPRAKSRRVVDEDDDVDRPVRKKKKRPKSSAGFFTRMEEDDASFMRYLGISCAALAGSGVLSLLHPIFLAPLGLTFLAVVLIDTILWWKTLIREEGPWSIAIAMFVPFAGLIYMIRQWHYLWKPFVSSIVASILFYGFLLGAVVINGGLQKNHNAAEFRPR